MQNAGEERNDGITTSLTSLSTMLVFAATLREVVNFCASITASETRIDVAVVTATIEDETWLHSE